MSKRMKIAIPIGIAVILLMIAAVLYNELYYLEGDVSLAYGLTVASEDIHLSSRETAQLNADLTVIDSRSVKRAERKMRAGTYSYEVKDPSVLSVSSDGTVTPKKVGETEITVRFAELSKTVHVEVYIPIDRISLSEHKYSLHVGESIRLITVVEPANATLYDGTYYSTTNARVASVNESGYVKAEYPGNAVIRMDSNGFSDMASIYVDAPLRGISINEKEVNLIKGETFSYEITYDPEYTTDSKDVVYTVEDETIGTVDETGLFTALAGGQTVLTARVGKYTVTSSIDVRVPMTGIRLPGEALTMRAGDSVTLPVGYEPADTTDDRTLTWSSSDSSIAAVDEEGTVRAVGAGTAVITAACGEFEASMRITVIIPVTGVSISASSLTLDKGTTGQLNATVLPVNTTEERYIYWASDNARVATVDGNGVITAVGPGTARIVAYHDDYSATCTVTVLSHIERIEFEQSDISLIETFTAPLGVIFTPLDTTDDKTVTFWSADPSVAVIEGNTVRAVSAGTTTIVATVGNHTAQAEVLVSPFVEVESVTVNTDRLNFDNIGDVQRLTATVYPADATAGSVSYSSSDSYVATVSSNGEVRATGSGDCVIIVSAGGQSARVHVHVSAENIVIVLDPGHGSPHGGAEWVVNGTTVYEQDLNLRVAKVAQEYLMSHYAGITVYLTHDTINCFGHDNAYCLRSRCDFAQNKNAAFLVSCHFNMSASHTASGPIAYISAPADDRIHIHEESVKIAESIISKIEAETGLKRLDKGYSWNSDYIDPYTGLVTGEDYYAINRHSAARGFPGVIIEHCFMDHDTEYLTDEYLVKFGIADAKGIAAYLGLPEK